MTAEPAILAIFGSPPPDLDLHASRIVGDNVAVIVLAVIATGAVVLRMMARGYAGTRLWADDFVIIIALLFSYATAAASIVGGHFGAGKHVWALTVPKLVDIMETLYVYTFIYAAAVSSTKLSILLWYSRIFSTSERYFKLCLYFCHFLVISYPIVIWITMANTCRPQSYFWTRFEGTTGSCISTPIFFLALGIINALNDLIILSTPIPEILKLHMSAKMKAGIIGVLALGSFVCIASAVRIYYLSVFSGSIDITWVMGPVFIWSSVEPSIGILSCCLPNMRPIYVRFRDKVTSVDKSRTTGYGASRSGTGGQGGALGSLGRQRLGSKDDDEIGLTNLATAGGASDTDSLPLPRNCIMVKSSVEQKTTYARTREVR